MYRHFFVTYYKEDRCQYGMWEVIQFHVWGDFQREINTRFAHDIATPLDDVTEWDREDTYYVSITEPRSYACYESELNILW